MFVIHLEGYLADSIKRQLAIASVPSVPLQCLHWWP